MDVGHKAYMPRFSTRVYGETTAKAEQLDGGGVASSHNYQMSEHNLDSLPFYGTSDRY